MASVDLQEKANFTRLCRLLVDKGTQALRNTLDNIHPPPNLPAVLNANLTSLLRLRGRVINDVQWDSLFPPPCNPLDSKTFDVTLLTILLRNICGLPSPATGWNAMPPDADNSDEANITRIKIFRNEVYAHVSSTQVDEVNFTTLWQKISKALVDLNIPQKEIDDLKNCPLGPEEEIYVQSLKEWFVKEEDSKHILLDLQQIAQEIREEIKQLQESKDGEKRTNNADVQQLRKLAKHNFKSKIQRKVTLFHPGTRDWLITKLENWFTAEEESRLFILTAGPGFGKSVFAGKICELFEEKEKFAACHFCDFNDSNLNDPMTMLQSLASQMCDNVVGFQEKLLDQLIRPHKIHSLKDAFQIYLQNPLDELEIEPSLIVIDGLDGSATDDKSEIVKLIADHFPDLPKSVKVLVTSRPEVSLTRLDHIEISNVDTQNWENKLDIRKYLVAKLPSLAPKNSVHLFSENLRMVVENCEGSFLYAYHVQRELSKRKNLDTITSGEIVFFFPKGIGSVYERYFRRLEIELEVVLNRNTDLFLKLLEIIVAANRPLPLTFLARVLDLNYDSREMRRIIKKVNDAVSSLLYVSVDDLVTVFHRSVYDWLCASGYDSHEYTVKVSDGRKRLWLLCERVFEEIKRDVTSGRQLKLTNEVKHALEYGHKYLVESNTRDSYSWLVDIIIVHVILTVHPKNIIYSYDVLHKVLHSDVDIGLQLRQKISWHLVEIFKINMDACFSYLEAVLGCSPQGCFTQKEKEIAEMLLANSSSCVKSSSDRAKITNLLTAKFIQHTYIKVVSVSSDKKLTAVASGDGVISVLSLPELILLWQYATGCNCITCCTFTPDDSSILYGRLETVLNIAKKKEVSFFDGKEERFQSCAFSANGKRLITNDGSSTVKLWNVVRQSLLSFLYAGVPLGFCSFSNSGLFIIGDQKNAEEAAYSVWNAITLQRVDQRRLPKADGVETSERCNRCVPQERKELIPSKMLEIMASLQLSHFKSIYKKEVEYSKLSTGVYHGEGCIFYLGRQSLRVIECTHFTTLAAWETYIHDPWGTYIFNIDQVPIVCNTAIEDDLWLYAEKHKVVVVSTVPQKQDQSCRSRVLWCSFSPDGTRLATCTEDGFINLWNVDKCKVYQRFRGNNGTSSAACWWSKRYLFVFHVIGKIPFLSKYLVDETYKITITQGQPKPLVSFVIRMFLPSSDILDFSEGYLSFTCGSTEPVKVLDVNNTECPEILMLPGIKPMMSIAVSAGGTFVIGTHLVECLLWKRDESNPAVYSICGGFTLSSPLPWHYLSQGCFSNDSKLVVSYVMPHSREIFCIDVVSNAGVRLLNLIREDRQPNCDSRATKIFCTNRAVIFMTRQEIEVFDLKSCKFIGGSFRRHLIEDFVIPTKLSPKGNVLAVPRLTGDMEFIQIRLPGNL